MLTSGVFRNFGLRGAVAMPLGEGGPPSSESPLLRDELSAVHFRSSSQARSTPAWQSFRVMSVRVEDRAQKEMIPTEIPPPMMMKRSERECLDR